MGAGCPDSRRPYRRLLLIGEKLSACASLAERLAAAGHPAAIACELETALALCRIWSFDLVVVDQPSGLSLAWDFHRYQPFMPMILVGGNRLAAADAGLGQVVGMEELAPAVAATRTNCRSPLARAEGRSHHVR